MAIKRVETIKEQVYHILKDSICNGEFEANERLQEVDLAEKLNVSRSPIRDALRLLVADGLAVEIPNKGVYVKSFSEKDIEDIFDFRLMLECQAVKNISDNLSEKNAVKLNNLLSDIEEAFNENDIVKYTKADCDLHNGIMELCGNELIKATYLQLSSMISQFRIYSLADPKRFVASLSEHREIVTSILQRNPEVTKQAIEVHLTRAKDDIKDHIRRNKIL